ncbi:hypothetical protein TI39_contig412g00047 [Zymoseptoria brevis]|uniref:Uncharacterized protein n=1 Tax=Zymoseptoria brevis TaxID=1047168 RepID=A0A0F4GMI8_9PEZI|nr:hypothetical protein TI39_contig412g00047 [Zymoseptoria brevis]
MASNGLSLQQQKGSLETRIKLLINNDLKTICREFDYQVSGTKATLQQRVIEALNDVVKAGDEAGFNKLNYMVANRGQLPRSPTSNTASASNHNNNTQNHNSTASSMVTGGAYAPYGNNDYARPQQQLPRAKYFKSSPFYDVIDTVMPRQELPDMPQNRHTVRAILALSPDHVKTLKDDPSMRLMLFCGMSGNMSPYVSVDVAFPNQLEVKINGDDVKHNFKGLKNKPGTTKPTDITDKVRKAQGYQNQLSITYALTKNRFAVVVHMVKMVSVEVLVERLRSGKVGGIISKQRVIDEMNRASKDDDISATSVRMSLKDPTSTLRIKLPIRSSVCTHNQCFDGEMFLQLQEQAPQWQCVVCNKSVTFESLCVDKYFEDILQRTPTSIEKVDIEPNGEWKVIKEEEEDVPQNGASSKANRASYDDDFDDDLIELSDEETKPPNGLVKAVQGIGTPGIFSPSGAFNTPPLSSRGPSAAPSLQSAGNKRPGSAIIDLTFSDDEDEPPRPAKRQTTSRQVTTTQQQTAQPLPQIQPDLFPPPVQDKTSSIQTRSHTSTTALPSTAAPRRPYRLPPASPTQEEGWEVVRAEEAAEQPRPSLWVTLRNPQPVRQPTSSSSPIQRPSRPLGDFLRKYLGRPEPMQEAAAVEAEVVEEEEQPPTRRSHQRFSLFH